jgi:hypothetical protein
MINQPIGVLGSTRIVTSCGMAAFGSPRVDCASVADRSSGRRPTASGGSPPSRQGVENKDWNMQR